MSRPFSATELANGYIYPNTRPRNAAALILIDRSESEPKVLLGKRHRRHAFLPGHFVFPGGRIEAADGRAPAAAELNPGIEVRLARLVAGSHAEVARAFALAAIRETFEETGFVVGRKKVGAGPPAGGRWAKFLRTGIIPDLSGLRLIARAITPPRASRRFDARFFAVDAAAIAHQAEDAVHADAELTEIVWVGLKEALRLQLADITEIVLADVGERLAAGFAHDVPVPLYRMKGGQYARVLL